MLTGGAGVEPLRELKDAVTGEDIVDKLLFVVCVLKEHGDPHALKNWKKKDPGKSTLFRGENDSKQSDEFQASCRTAAPNHTEKDEKTLNEPLHRPLHKHLTKNSQILAVYKATTYHVSLHLWDWPLDAR